MTTKAVECSRTAFPDFELDVALPDGFEDVSFANDACPSFASSELDVILMIDYADREMREYPETERFSLIETENGMYPADKPVVHLVDTDDYQVVLETIAERALARSSSPKV